MARYSVQFKQKAVARLLPPESAKVSDVARQFGLTPATLERWCDRLQSMPALGRAWTAVARLDAVITTSAVDEAAKNGWCCERGIDPSDLEKWRESATMALVNPGEAKASALVDAKAERKRIKTSERELGRKDKVLAETAALLVLSKKVAAIFNKAEDEWQTSKIAKPLPKVSLKLTRREHDSYPPVRLQGPMYEHCNAGLTKPIRSRPMQAHG